MRRFPRRAKTLFTSSVVEAIVFRVTSTSCCDREAFGLRPRRSGGTAGDLGQPADADELLQGGPTLRALDTGEQVTVETERPEMGPRPVRKVHPRNVGEGCYEGLGHR